MAIAVMPALFFTAFSVIAGEFDATAELFDHENYFNLNGSMALIFVALAASELLIPDRINGTMAVYASRPLTTPDYVMGRAASLAIVVFGFLWIPHLVLFLGRAWVGSSGFGTYVVDNAAILWKTAVVSVVYFAAYTSIAFLVAAFSKRTAVAAGVFLGIVMLSATTEALVDAGFSVFGLGDPGYQHRDLDTGDGRDRTGHVAVGDRHADDRGRTHRYRQIPESGMTTSPAFVSDPTITVDRMSKWFGQKVAV